MIAAVAQRAIDEKTKPLGSLGELETWTVSLACIQNTVTPRLDRARILVLQSSSTPSLWLPARDDPTSPRKSENARKTGAYVGQAVRPPMSPPFSVASA